MKSTPTLLPGTELLALSRLKPPSTVRLLLSLRLPLTAMVPPPPVVCAMASKSSSGAPGTSVASCRKLRPLSARLWTCSPSTTRAISPEVVLTVSPACAVTVTVSLTWPASSVGINGQATVGHQHVAARHERLEAAELDRHHVIARRQIGDDVEALVIGPRRARDLCGLVRDGHGRARHDGVG